MSNNPDFVKGGKTPNPYGRGGDPSKPKEAKPYKSSKLRKLERDLTKLNQAALINIENSVNGIDVPKSRLDSSKWVVNTLVAVSKAAMSEEITINGLSDKTGNKAHLEDIQGGSEDEATPLAIFDMDLLVQEVELVEEGLVEDDLVEE